MLNKDDLRTVGKVNKFAGGEDTLHTFNKTILG